MDDWIFAEDRQPETGRETDTERASCVCLAPFNVMRRRVGDTRVNRQNYKHTWRLTESQT